jgi:O-antigen/teichoic acid export membrane protein
VGAILAQAITFLSLPVLARVYGPVEFGRYSILIAVALMLTPLATLKLETLMVVEKNNQKAGLYLHLAFFMTLSISILILICSLLMAWILEGASTIKFEHYWLFVPLIIIVNSLILLTQQIALRDHSYKTFSITGISQSTFVALSQIGLSIVTPKAINLIFGWFIGKIVGVSWVLHKTRDLWKSHTGERGIYFKTLRKIYPQIKLLNQGSVFEAIAVAFPTVYVGITFGNELAGIFSMSQVLLMAPIVLVGSGIGSLILSEYSSDSGSGIQITDSQKRGVRKVFLALILISLFYITFYYLFAGILVRNLLGPAWIPAVELLNLIIIPYSVWLVWYPLVNLFWSKQKWRSYRKFSLIRMILPMALAIISYIFSSDWKIAICLISWGTAVSQLFGIYMLDLKWKFLNSSDLERN